MNDKSSIGQEDISVPTIAELVREIEKTRIEAGYTTEELLLSLREERDRYYLENYANF